MYLSSARFQMTFILSLSNCPPFIKNEIVMFLSQARKSYKSLRRNWAKKKTAFPTTHLSSSVRLSLHHSVVKSSPTDMAIAEGLIEVELLRFPFLPVQPISAVPCSQPALPEIETYTIVSAFSKSIVAKFDKRNVVP